MYWEKFYATAGNTDEPSCFAEYCLSKLKELQFQPCELNTLQMLDIGCGNGRDTMYFYYNGINKIEGMDISSTIIELNQSYYPMVNFFVGDLCNSNFSKFVKKYDVLYARFFLHSIPQDSLSTVIQNLYALLNDNGYVFIETRSMKETEQRKFNEQDILNKTTKYIETNYTGSIGQSHYRVLYKADYLQQVFLAHNFKMISLEEGKGMAPFLSEDPYVIRLIGQKKQIHTEESICHEIQQYVHHVQAHKLVSLGDELTIPPSILQHMCDRIPTPELFYALMKDVHHIFISMKIPYFAVAGTLLGIMRNGKKIAWDDDIDIGILDKDESRLVGKTFRQRCDQYDIEFKICPEKYMLYYKFAPNAFLDIFPYELKSNGTVNFNNNILLYQFQQLRFYLHMNELFPLRQVNYGTAQIYTIAKPIPVLKRWYGANCFTTMRCTHFHSMPKVHKLINRFHITRIGNAPQTHSLMSSSII